uniref:Dedicator of cytokinesis protein 9 isoform X1 n=1 Tax=Petromyzon marinus TaxID=7757 RepID=A0AAJ7UEB4_PETMA|nr:dedicator of cytokinesis protein 9 isoform X1 [Petromyzon marinus]
MAEARRFTKSLSKPGTAAEMRQSASEAVRRSTYSQVRPRMVEPLDYESVIQQRRTQIHSDPLRDLLLFPHDDVTVSRQPRQRRTVVPSVPPEAAQEARSLLVTECIKSYTTSWNVLDYRYQQYTGDYRQLPQNAAWLEKLPTHTFDIDEDVDKEEDTASLASLKGGIMKQGWLYKGNVNSVSMRSFKRRYFSLTQLPDGSFILNFYKDEKLSKEPKGSIFLDSCVGVVQTPKVRRFAFELRMQHHRAGYVLAAESDADCDEWSAAITRVLALAGTGAGIGAAGGERRNGDGGGEHDEDAVKPESLTESLESSMHPELIKYARETDHMNKTLRSEARHKLFSLDPDMQRCAGGAAEAPPRLPHDAEALSHRILVSCHALRFALQAPASDDGDDGGGDGDSTGAGTTNVEPFFVSLALFDARASRKISSDFHVDLNQAWMRRVLLAGAGGVGGEEEGAPGGGAPWGGDGGLGQPRLVGVSADNLRYPTQAVFSVAEPHCDVFLVARVDKVLQGGVAQCAEPYIKNHDSGKIAQKVQKQMRQVCVKLAPYHMPFAWAARPVFREGPCVVDRDSRFSALFRQDSAKLSDEDLLKTLSEFRKPERMAKLQVIPGSLDVTVEVVPAELPNCVTSSYVPVHPFHLTPEGTGGEGISGVSGAAAVVEVEEFVPEEARLAQPFAVYRNHLYVYPRALKYDGQRSFPKARNLAVCIEFRDSDAESAQPLPCVYGKPGGPPFVMRAVAAVLHHQHSPEFYDEVKIRLPTQLHSGHHLLFSFFHISCEVSGKAATKKREAVETQVGYAWLPLLRDGRVVSGEVPLSASASLPAGYLASNDTAGATKHVGPDIRWVDGGKQVFRVATHLVSTIYTQDQHLHNFFSYCERAEEAETGGAPLNEGELIKYLKSLHAVESHVMVAFLPTLLNQLFHVLTHATHSDVAINATRVLIHVVSQCHEEELDHFLHSYVTFVFKTEESAEACEGLTLHEELAKSLGFLLKPSTDFLTCNKLLKFSWFFFEILIKSMAQNLVDSGRIKLNRTQRLPASFHTAVEDLVVAATENIVIKHRDFASETRRANHSLAAFIKRCFTFMDRGFLFKLINLYMHSFGPGDPKTLFEFKLAFLKEICSHEHYIPLNLAMSFSRGRIQRYQDLLFPTEATREGLPDLQLDYSLTEDFCKNHFLVGLLLREVSSALQQESGDVRPAAIAVLKQLMAKHAHDDRYAHKNQQARIASLYLPLLGIALENVSRLNVARDHALLPSASANTCTVTRDDFTACVQNPVPGGATSNAAGSCTPHRAQAAATATAAGDLFSAISGTGTPGQLVVRHADSRASLVSIESATGLPSAHDKANSLEKQGAGSVLRLRPLEHGESRSLLLCVLHVLKSVSEDALLAYWNKASDTELLDFFTLLEICLHQFKYMGKRYLARAVEAASPVRSAPPPPPERKSQTLPAPRNLLPSRAASLHARFSHLPSAEPGASGGSLHHSYGHSEVEAVLEAALATEAGLVVLDALACFTHSFKEQLLAEESHGRLMRRVFDVLLTFLAVPQSEATLRHVFAVLRGFINKFPAALFTGRADMCASLCYELLKCCSAKLGSTRSEACALLYLLMRNNFEYTGRKSFVRSHLQIIIAVSQLIADVVGIGGSRFQHSLSIVNNYANSDKAMKATAFPAEVKDLTKRIRTVLMATAQMKEHAGDPELLADLQYSLARSYASTPELRKAWLESMARTHLQHGDLSEAAMCYVHVAALVAEYLKRKGSYTRGCAAFRVLSPNVDEEAAMKEDAGMEDVHFNEDVLVELLERVADALWKAERYELLADVYRLVVPVFEKRRDFQRLSQVYNTLHLAYKKVVEVTHSGRRLLGTFFRVAFFGQAAGFFEEEDGKEYVYKEPKLTGLAELSQRLLQLYAHKFGASNVRMLQDSGKVNAKDLDPRCAYIQVTYVTPYFEEKEQQERRSEFERCHGVRRFAFETPYTLGGGGARQGGVHEQCKRRTVLTTTHAFPYVKKRVPVMYEQHVELGPVEVAVDEMSARAAELRALSVARDVDMIKLQLKLQGCVSPQVNAGPLAYARAFLDESNAKKFPDNKVKQLKEVFRLFVEACGQALEVNERLIKEDQLEYHEDMKTNYRDMVQQLADITRDAVPMESGPPTRPSLRDSVHVFSAISGTPTGTTLSGVPHSSSSV